LYIVELQGGVAINLTECILSAKLLNKVMTRWLKMNLDKLIELKRLSKEEVVRNIEKLGRLTKS
jgi:hypothetical protein